jgi:hypothetical protein
MFNHPVFAEATITFTGEDGAVEALEQFVARLWPDWQDAFRQWQQSGVGNAPSGLCERLDRPNGGLPIKASWRGKTWTGANRPASWISC